MNTQEKEHVNHPTHYKEPQLSKYIFVSDKNKVRIMVPAMRGQVISAENTCKTGAETKIFFTSLQQILKNYMGFFMSTEENSKYTAYLNTAFTDLIQDNVYVTASPADKLLIDHKITQIRAIYESAV